MWDEDSYEDQDTWTIDPRDLREHRQAGWKQIQKRMTFRTLPDACGEIDDPPTDDAMLSTLEPFGLTGRYLQQLAIRVRTIGDARAVIRDGIKIRQIGIAGRRCLAEALERADKWLEDNKVMT
jgi:hypothetical protein